MVLFVLRSNWRPHSPCAIKSHVVLNGIIDLDNIFVVNQLIGLKYILELFSIKQIELAEKLGIKKQNINLWIKRKQKISKKHLPTLEQIFGIDAKYFSKELTDLDKLEIQKEKLKRDLQPIITKYEEQFLIGEENNLISQEDTSRVSIIDFLGSELLRKWLQNFGKDLQLNHD